MVIINWRLAEELRGVIPTIRAQQTRHNVETIVVNKPSGDGTEELLREHPWVRLISHDVFGIAEMRNVGIKAARGRYCLMLDADTEVLPGCFDALVDFMDRHPQVGACGARTRRLNGEVEYNIKRFYNLTTIAVRRSPLGRLWPDNPWNRRHLMLDKDHGRSFYGDWVAGACFCMRREAIEEAGLFDDRYYFGFEDVDWCWRVKRRGWKVAFCANAGIIHKVQRMSAGINRLTVEHLRSGLLFWWKIQRTRLGLSDRSPTLKQARPALSASEVNRRAPDLDISLVIINSNGKGLLKACLDSLPVACEGITWEAVVVDNGSTDGSVEMMRREYPDTPFVANRDNRGFTRANNQGLAIARGRYLVLLNNDTEAKPDSFAAAVRYLDEHKDIGAAGLKLLNTDGTRQLSCRRFPSFQQALFNRYSLLTRLFPNNAYSRSYLMTDLDEDENAVRDVDWVSGACLIFRRSLYDRIGPLDERYWMYSEDVDYCLRVWKAGLRVSYVPVGAVFHHIGQDTGNYPFKLMIERHRSMYRFYKKHYSRELLFLDVATAVMVACRCGVKLSGLAWKRHAKARERRIAALQSQGGGAS